MKTRASLQSKLFGTFTILFAFSVVVLAFFLYNAVRMVGLHNQTQTAFELNRQVYRLVSVTQQFEQALKYYEANGSDANLERATGYASRMEDMVENLRPQMLEEEISTLDTYEQGRLALVPLVEQIEQAVLAEDWEQVQALDDEVYQHIPGMYESLDAVTQSSTDYLDYANGQVDTLNVVAWIGSIVAPLVFLALALAVALLMYNQINRPLETLAQAAEGLLAGKFNAQAVQELAGRDDEIGYMAGEFTGMAETVEQRTTLLRQEAEEIRAKIR